MKALYDNRICTVVGVNSNITLTGDGREFTVEFGEFPFMVTANEVRVSARDPDGYHLYRVFEFAKAARLYVLPGALSERCRLEATQYRARP